MATATATAEAEHLFYAAARLAAVGRAAEAAERYRNCLQLSPSSFTAAENLGIALSEVGHSNEAIDAFQIAVQLQPTRSESYSLLARTLYESGYHERGRTLFEAAIALRPSRPELHYELARSEQLFGVTNAADSFRTSQRLAYMQWREQMACTSTAAGSVLDSPWTVGGHVKGIRTLHQAGSKYGRLSPRPFSPEGWPKNAGLAWPPLEFKDRAITMTEFEDVWISGNDGVITDAECGIYTTHGFEVPLHLNLPHERVEERHIDPVIRRTGKDDILLSLTQLFSANFYSFFADSLARLVVALDAIGVEMLGNSLFRAPSPLRLRVALPADGARLKPWMWSLLERLGIDKNASFPYPVRPFTNADGLRKAAAARVHAARLVVIDWRPRPADAGMKLSGSFPSTGYVHLPARTALLHLRERLAFPGAHIAWASQRRTIVYFQRAGAKIRKIANEPQLLSSIGEVANECNGCKVRILSDAPPMSLADTASVLSQAAVLLGVHGAGWANMIFAGKGAHAIEMALPEVHAVYTAHLAFALGLAYHLVPLRGAALHSASHIRAPIVRVRSALRRAVSESLASDRRVWTAEEQATCAPAALANAAAPAATATQSSSTATDTHRSVEVVLARYREDPSWCVSFNCTIYNKGSSLGLDTQALKQVRLRSLPNIGRESHTWLSHIVDHWDSLADWTVFMQGEPWDHLPPGLTVQHYVDASRSTHQTFFPLTVMALSNLRGLAFRSGYAPFAPFTGTLEGSPGSWSERNIARLPILLQPLGLWSGDGELEQGSEHYCSSSEPCAFVNRSGHVAVSHRALDGGLTILNQDLHWIAERSAAQGDRGLAHFWRKFMASEVPTRLYHAQGAQFGVRASAVRRHPRSLYRAMLAELQQSDPVASYYCELIWWYLFDSDASMMASNW